MLFGFLGDVKTSQVPSFNQSIKIFDIKPKITNLIKAESYICQLGDGMFPAFRKETEPEAGRGQKASWRRWDSGDRSNHNGHISPVGKGSLGPWKWVCQPPQPYLDPHIQEVDSWAAGVCSWIASKIQKWRHALGQSFSQAYVIPFMIFPPKWQWCSWSPS